MKAVTVPRVAAGRDARARTGARPCGSNRPGSRGRGAAQGNAAAGPAEAVVGAPAAPGEADDTPLTCDDAAD